MLVQRCRVTVRPILAHCYSPPLSRKCPATFRAWLERFTSCEQLFTDLQAIGTIHVERPYGRAPHRGQAHNQGALKSEVLVPAVASGVKQARVLSPHPPRLSTISQVLWRLGLQPIGRSSTSRVVSSWPQTNWTRPGCRRKQCWTDTKGKLMQNAAFASSKTRSFWPRRSISKSLNASWPY